MDEKSQIQALDRSAPVLPGVPERQRFDYVRHGTTSLFAALEVATGQVISAVKRRHRHQGVPAFLRTIDTTVPIGLDVHVILDNLATHKTPAVKAWLLKHPRFQLHFTPTGSSWLNLVERFFAEITVKLLRRGVHRSVTALEHDIRTWIQQWNTNPGHTYGPEQPTRSWSRSPHCGRITTQDTRGAGKDRVTSRKRADGASSWPGWLGRG